MKEFVKKFIPHFLLGWYHQFWPFLGAVVYGFPSRKLIVIGVTGTNGKTTVVDWTARVLEEAGHKVASVSSLRFKIGEREKLNMLKMTMPGRMKLQKFLRDAVSAGCQYAVLEATSEGIAQHRHSFIDFDAAVFTNLSPEHIERHGGFENYKKAKGELFRALKNFQFSIFNFQSNSKPQFSNKARKISIINIDDPNAEYFLRFPADEKYGFTISDCRFQISNCIKANGATSSLSGIDFKVDDIQFHIPIIGGFNVYNALVAICAGLSQGVDLETCKRALEKVKGVPGRMEIVVREPFTVVVDYAHTPVALENVYEAVKCQMSNVKCRMICVLGAAGGGRDRWKRPELGRIAARYCDAIILTNEDPYDENPGQILSEIKSGISNPDAIEDPRPSRGFKPSTRAKPRSRTSTLLDRSSTELCSSAGLGAGPVPHRNEVSGAGFQISNLYEILDRREAIRKAFELAKAGDAVVITGKGSEPWMCVDGGKKIPWDDRTIVREGLMTNQLKKPEHSA